MIVNIPKHRLDELADELDSHKITSECSNAQRKFRTSGSGATVHRVRNSMVIVEHILYRLKNGKYQSKYFSELRQEDPIKYDKLVQAIYLARSLPPT